VNRIADLRLSICNSSLLGWRFAMRFHDTLAAKLIVWLGAALVPVEALPVVACGCEEARSKSHVLQPVGLARHGCCRAGSPHPNPLPKGEGTGGCCGCGSHCTCGLLCRCGQTHRHEPLVPSNSGSLKAKDLAGQAVVATVCRGGVDAQPREFLLGDFSLWTPTTLERLSVLSRFLI
jgi:hypothetical protein